LLEWNSEPICPDYDIYLLLATKTRYIKLIAND
jgi:hypothetical protein